MADRGYTLTELLVVVVLIGLAAAVALPSLRPADSAKLDLAANQFANAIRFARAEAMRTGLPHGFRYLSAQKRIRVFTSDTSTNPPGYVFDVRHPIDKHLYDYTLPSEFLTHANPVTRQALYRGTCNTPGIVYFDANGTPRCNDPATVLVDTFSLVFNIEPGAVVQLDGMTGRVTVQ